MKNNVNKNGVRVLKTTKKDCFCHPEIPGFVIGKKQPFTIQLGLLLTNDTDAVLYAQVDGFSIEIINRCLKFSMKGFCELETPEEYKLSSQRAYDIAIRHHNNILTMFLDGKPVAEKKVSRKAATGKGHYVIGKQFMGGFTSVRVLSKALSDDEILKQTGYQPLPDKDCVFQTDCSTIQYKDISKNKLGIWTENSGACCDVMTKCATLDGNGCYQWDVAASDRTAETVLIKLWPNPEQRRQTIYTALSAEGICYSLDLIPQPNYSFRLCLNGCGKEILLPKELLPQLWQDVALVFYEDYVRIYLDGVFQAKYSFTNRYNRTSIVVGAENQTHETPFEKGYSGYLAYTAEFSRALTAGEVSAFFNEPPYEFESSLSAYLKLDEPEAMELISGSPVTVKGSAAFQFIDGTTPFETTLWFPTKSKHFIWTTDPSENRSGITEGALGTDLLHHRISPALFKQWMDKLDKAYDTYRELVGGAPSDGDVIRLVPGDPEMKAFYVSGAPRCPYIFMHVDSLPSLIDSIQSTHGEDVSFAVTHELGHLFDIADWTFHSEFFANIKMYYMLEKNGFKVNLDGLQGGKERMEDLYQKQLVEFDKDKEHYPIFDGPTAEHPLLVFYPVLMALGGWESGWQIMKEVFKSYLVPESKQPDGYTGEYSKAKNFFDRISEISGTDITRLFPDGLKREMEERYFKDTSSRKVPYIRYDGPDGTLSNGSGSLVLKFMECAKPIAGNKISVSMCKKEYRYHNDAPIPVRVGFVIRSFECELTDKDVPEKNGDAWLLSLPFSRFAGLKEILDKGVSGTDTSMAACQVEVDSGAFAYEDGILTHQKSWKEPFYRKIFSPSVIDGTFPQYEAVKVTENGIISVSFQRNMDKATGVISLDKNVGVLDGEWDVEGLVYTAFYTGLSEGKVYTALFSGFKDLEGNLIPDSKSIFTRDDAFPYVEERINLHDLPGLVTKEKWSFDGTVLNVCSDANIVLSGSVDNGRRIVVKPESKNVRITLDNLSITGNHPMRIPNAEVTLVLAEGSENVLTATNENSAGICTDHSHLVIEGTGRLTVSGGAWRPAIGGVNSDITINNGSVTAKGGINAAGIGGQAKDYKCDGNGGIITINGGTVIAIGGGRTDSHYGGAGIGGGAGGNGGKITITGGNVTACSADNSNGTGIGGGGNGYGVGFNGGNGGCIRITGGVINAKSLNAAAIGGGFDGESGIIIISGGYIIAEGTGAPGIGSGSINVNECNITIQGGTINASSSSGPAIGCWQNTGSVIITGGSIECSNTINPSPKNKEGVVVYNNVLSFPICGEGDFYVTGGHSGDITFKPEKILSTVVKKVYGIYNVKLDKEKKVGLWLPEGSKVEIVELVVKKVTYWAEYIRPKEKIEQALSEKNELL